MQEKLISNSPSETWFDYVNSGLLWLGPLKVWLIVLLVLVPFVWLMKTQASRKFFVFCGSLILIPLIFAIWFQTTTAAFVTQQPQELYDGPSKIFRSERVLPAGAKVMARERNGWWYVVFPPNATGWLPQDGRLRVGELWGME